jgi:hypothetical protein
MADPTQYSFDLNELATALLKHQGIHDGLWAVSFEITMGVGSFGPTQAEAKPGAFMQINKVQISRQSPETPEGSMTSMTVDAAKVNPAQT